MPKTEVNPLNIARAALENRRDFDDFVASLGQRDRTNIERHLVALDALPNPQHAKLWKRLAATLSTLAPLSAQTNGQQAVQFFIADGKYRMQAFALEDLRDGKIQVYAPDALADAVKVKLLGEPVKVDEDAPPAYRIGGDKSNLLSIDSLDAKNTNNPAPYYANMIGWNRKALRIALALPAHESQIAALEMLCALASSKINKTALPQAVAEPRKA